MAKLSKPFSLAAYAIESAIAEGDAEAAMHKLIAALRSDRDDKAMRLLAADWIESIGLLPGSAKALRKGQKKMLQEWHEISEMVTSLQSSGTTYAVAVEETAKHFKSSTRHVQKCVAEWNQAQQQYRESDQPNDC